MDHPRHSLLKLLCQPMRRAHLSIPPGKQQVIAIGSAHAEQQPALLQFDNMRAKFPYDRRRQADGALAVLRLGRFEPKPGPGLLQAALDARRPPFRIKILDAQRRQFASARASGKPQSDDGVERSPFYVLQEQRHLGLVEDDDFLGLHLGRLRQRSDVLLCHTPGASMDQGTVQKVDVANGTGEPVRPPATWRTGRQGEPGVVSGAAPARCAWQSGSL